MLYYGVVKTFDHVLQGFERSYSRQRVGWSFGCNLTVRDRREWMTWHLHTVPRDCSLIHHYFSRLKWCLYFILVNIFNPTTLKLLIPYRELRKCLTPAREGWPLQVAKKPSTGVMCVSRRWGSTRCRRTSWCVTDARQEVRFLGLWEAQLCCKAYRLAWHSWQRSAIRFNRVRCRSCPKALPLVLWSIVIIIIIVSNLK